MLEKYLPRFPSFTLAVALSISLVAAFYSIVGLVAIFAAAAIPIIIMGSVLEVAKITTTVWLHRYWDIAGRSQKAYLCTAVVVLACLTSMGIFGFLSKAHLDQGVPTGDVAAKVALLDEKIKTERDNIEASRAALKQMDEQVNQTLGRSTTESGADKSVSIRKAQAKERASLQKDIETSQKKIAALNEERAPIASELRKVEAEVGPIKYIAALIYGDNPDENTLERAVRWVIILIVVVFDPLAITLVLAAIQSKEWEDDGEVEIHGTHAVKAHHDPEPTENTVASPEEFFARGREIARELDAQEEQHRAAEANAIADEAALLDDQDRGDIHWHVAPEEVVHATPELTLAPPSPVELEPEQGELLLVPATVAEIQVEPTEMPTAVDITETTEHQPVTVEEFSTAEVDPRVMLVSPTPEFEIVDTEQSMEDEAWEHMASKAVAAQPQTDIIGEQANASSTNNMLTDLGSHVAYDGKTMSKEVFRDLYPREFAQTANPDHAPTRTAFGTEFPASALPGDAFVRVDSIPNRVFKFNGSKWIEVDRHLSDSYLHDREYIKHLISKIESGEYDPELLSDSEQDEIAEYLRLKAD